MILVILVDLYENFLCLATRIFYETNLDPDPGGRNETDPSRRH